ncbi:unnamed protein product [Phytophthora fragariaefolia]|uniref:Unnamed protein product n=1 Tax=Phytophthora fragariaefolia TaxID=1490495 RepID=A0A9W6YA84_9STRA|nr:unnamed protein product [Phytophthora fragariaefolia]
MSSIARAFSGFTIAILATAEPQIPPISNLIPPRPATSTCTPRTALAGVGQHDLLHQGLAHLLLLPRDHIKLSSGPSTLHRGPESLTAASSAAAASAPWTSAAASPTSPALW